MQTEPVHIRPAVRADLGAVAGILAFYVTNSVATFEEDPPGLPQWQQRLDSLAGRGLPFLVAETGGVVAGYEVIAVIADSGDPASVALHRACGFADAGRLTRVGYKHGRWVDTLLMQRALEPGRAHHHRPGPGRAVRR